MTPIMSIIIVCEINMQLIQADEDFPLSPPNQISIAIHLGEANLAKCLLFDHEMDENELITIDEDPACVIGLGVSAGSIDQGVW